MTRSACHEIAVTAITTPTLLSVLTTASTRLMAASQVFPVIFVVIFVGFICLLVSLRQSQSEKPEYDDTDDDDNSNSSDVLVDLSRPYVTHCDACPRKSLRDHFCDTESFVIICSVVTDVTGTSGPRNKIQRRDRMYLIQVISQLKQFPDVNSSSIGRRSSIVYQGRDDSCARRLKSSRQYVLTGRINENGMAVVTPCEVAINWSALTLEKQHSLFRFFSPHLRC